MTMSWEIRLGWETLTGGSPEEEACFATFGILAGDKWLTEGHDALADRLRTQPYLSAYHFAEWAIWNWWRLRWEPRARSPEWDLSHNCASIGSGYIWPNLKIFSDGARTALIASPSEVRPDVPFRYISNLAAVVPSGDFEAGLDDFFNKVLERLDARALRSTNFHSIWESVQAERNSSELSQLRRLEALLGRDPDEADPALIQQIQADSNELGQKASEELAAGHNARGEVISLADLKTIAKKSGTPIDARDGAKLQNRHEYFGRGDVPAWVVGVRAARALRAESNLGNGPLSNARLAQLAGTMERALTTKAEANDLSFILAPRHSVGDLALRSRRETGRRFDLARLLGDRLLVDSTDRLSPATNSQTYRQKMQRAFAAELLCPFEALDAFLDGDYSDDAQADAAENYNVSQMTVETLLMNHNRIPRYDEDEFVESAVA